MKGKKQKNNPYSKNKFEYDEKRDCFICPNEEVLIKKGSMNTMARYSINITGQIVRSVYLEWISAGKGKMKQITSDEYEAERLWMADKMRSEEGKEEYKKTQGNCGFGHLEIQEFD
ncbi:MAG: hypothetical protein AEth_01903 [Candidatus Argoarchaeum ethanivorans]|uniref:Uncharacterized protein n=1 Tax=Candidatus Argoarchaeum ethanivorans TaxID=2608793 RepID=A0A8B3RZC2_9EURY|nr:MAG: hypothetical protein AEth_01903 [Candidatus Argoarchaeum ethanivorans]